ncbi:hypothetical protein KPH14_003232 [Odynerus spinipes]|uniref:Uncharacterized protein n=1 Tax=Odynerus spinipes TaxID=1348599 RepID=A0AAD9R8L3_9HYME|nr:hypothetical protein KPH14_003232 [Odynerus spinipes]
MEGRREILLTFPYPAQLTCELCPAAALGRTFRDGRQRGVFKGDRRHEDYVKHLKQLHKDEHVVTFKCGRCDYKGSGAYPRRAITSHFQKVHGSLAPGEGLGAVPPGQGGTGSRGTLPTNNNNNNDSNSSNGGGSSIASTVAATTTTATTTTTTTTTTTNTNNRNINDNNNSSNNNSHNNNNNSNCNRNEQNNNSTNNNSNTSDKNNNSSNSGGGLTLRAEGVGPRIVSIVNLGPKTIRVAGKGATRKLTAPTTQSKLNIKAMPVRTRATAATTTSTSTRATVSSPPATSTPPPTIAATRTTESTSTNTRTSTSRKSPAKRTPPALVEQAAPLVPRKRSSGGPTTSAAVRGAVSTKTPPHTTQEKKATTKVGQDSSKGDSEKKKAPAAPVKPSVGRRAPTAPPAARRITRAVAAALRLQKSGGEEPSIHNISAAKEESGTRITPQGPARPRRSIVTGALIRQMSSLGSTPRLRSSARLRGMPAATYAEIAAGRAVSTPITTTGGAEKRMGGEMPTTPPQTLTMSLTTLTTATITTTSCGGSITSPGVAPTSSPGASPRMSPVPLVAPIHNLVPHGRDPGPGFPPLTLSPRREVRRVEKTPAASPKEVDQGAQGNEGVQQGPSGGAEEEGAAARRTPSLTIATAAVTATTATETTITTATSIAKDTQEEDWRVVGRGRKRACTSPNNNENNNMRSPGGPLSPRMTTEGYTVALITI